MAQVSYKRTTPRCVFKVDPTKHPWEQEKKLHNRWHPDIPHVRKSKLFTLLGLCHGSQALHGLCCTAGWTAATQAAPLHAGQGLPKRQEKLLTKQLVAIVDAV